MQNSRVQNENKVVVLSPHGISLEKILTELEGRTHKTTTFKVKVKNQADVRRLRDRLISQILSVSSALM